jgi:hypothetical protein
VGDGAEGLESLDLLLNLTDSGVDLVEFLELE